MKKYFMRLWAKWQLRRLTKWVKKPVRQEDTIPYLLINSQYLKENVYPDVPPNRVTLHKEEERPQPRQSDIISHMVTGYVIGEVIENLFSNDSPSYDSPSSDSGSSDFGGFDGGDGGGGGASGDW